MPVYAWKIFLENGMVSIIPSNRTSEAQTFRNHHHLASSHRTQWKHLVFISERVSCIHVWPTQFSVVPKDCTPSKKSWTNGNSLYRKIQMCSCVKCTRVSGNFSLMFSIIPYDQNKLIYHVVNLWNGRGFTSTFPSIYVPSVINRFIFGHRVVIYFIMQSLIEKVVNTYLVFHLSKEICNPPSCLFCQHQQQPLGKILWNLRYVGVFHCKTKLCSSFCLFA